MPKQLWESKNKLSLLPSLPRNAISQINYGVSTGNSQKGKQQFIWFKNLTTALRIYSPRPRIVSVSLPFITLKNPQTTVSKIIIIPLKCLLLVLKQWLHFNIWDVQLKHIQSSMVKTICFCVVCKKLIVTRIASSHKISSAFKGCKCNLQK